jgi:hydroxypyruvate isomerase
MRLAANLSLMFCEVPLIERLKSADDAGFSVVEIQFPYEADLDDLIRARDECGVEMGLINLPPGDLAAGDRGLTCLPGRQQEFQDAVATGMNYARGLDVRLINCLSGCPPPGDRREATGTLIENLRYAADQFAEIGATVLVEPVNPGDVPGFMFNRLGPALDAVRATERDNVKLLFDFYHMAQTEPSLVDAVRQAGSLIGHVQFADTPGRHEPGSGTIDFDQALLALKGIGYEGDISAEYRPTHVTSESLDWMDKFATLINQNFDTS